MAIQDKNRLLYSLAVGEIRALAEPYDRHTHVAGQPALTWAHDQVEAKAALNAAFLMLWRRPEPSDPHSLGLRVLAAIRAETLQVRPK